jgi:hypothetical protein
MSACVYSAFVLFCMKVVAMRGADPPSKESYRLGRDYETGKGAEVHKDCRAIDRQIDRDCFLLESDIDFVHELCSANFMKPNFSTIIFMYFARKTKVWNYECRLENCFILQTDCITELCINIDCELHFPHHVDFLGAMKLLT